MLFTLNLTTSYLKTFVDNFEEQLVGKISGEKVNVKVNFPADYFRPALASKSAVFAVEIVSIFKLENKKLDNEFIKTATGFEDIEDLKDDIFDQMNINYSTTCRAIFKKELFDYLDSFYKIELPVGLVNEQTKFLKEMTGNQAQEASTLSTEAKLKSLKLSQRMVRCGLILADIAAKNGIQVLSEDVDQEIKNIIEILICKCPTNDAFYNEYLSEYLYNGEIKLFSGDVE